MNQSHVRGGLEPRMEAEKSRGEATGYGYSVPFTSQDYGYQAKDYFVAGLWPPDESSSKKPETWILEVDG